MPAQPTTSLELLRVHKPDQATVDGIARIHAEFETSFGRKLAAEAMGQLRHALTSTVAHVSLSRAVFRPAALSVAMVKALTRPNALSIDVLEHPRFRDLVDLLVAQYPLIEIGDTGNMTSHEMLIMEREMIALAGERSNAHVLPEQHVRASIAAKSGMSEEQIAATLVATRSTAHVSIIEGAAGAGKSYTMEAVRNSYASSGYAVIGTAVSYVAAKVLGVSANIPNAKALAKILVEMRHKRDRGAEYFTRPTLIVVDEAGMVDTRQMVELMRHAAASRYPVKIVLIGDSLQVSPVAAGAAMETLVAFYGTTRIDTIRRQHLESHRIAVRRLSRRQSGPAINTLVQQEAVHFLPNDSTRADRVVADYVSYRLSHPGRQALILAITNRAVADINLRIREVYKRLGLIQAEEVTVKVTDTRASWEAAFAVGDEIVLRSNNPQLPIYKIDSTADPLDESSWSLDGRLGVFNRNTGRIVGIRRARDPIGSHDFIVDLGGDVNGRVIVNSETFQREYGTTRAGLPMVHNFATTVYASQGQTVDRVFVLESSGMDFRTAYVALSRHRDRVDLYLNERDLHDRIDHVSRRRESEFSRPEAPGASSLGRYSRAEMLREVAHTFARDANNPTAMLYERTARLGIDTHKQTKDDATIVAPANTAEADAWDNDLRATLYAPLQAAVELAAFFTQGRPVSASAVAAAVKHLVAIAGWVGYTDHATRLNELAVLLAAASPSTDLWTLAPDQSDLADQFTQAAKSLIAAVDARQGLAQEILDRTLAGDSLGVAMRETVRVITERSPTVDIQSILGLPSAPCETTPVPADEIDRRRIAEPSPQPAAPNQATPVEPQAGLLGRFFSHFAPRSSPPAPGSALLSRANKAWRAAASWIATAPTPSCPVPWLPDPVATGVINPGGELHFHGRTEGPSLGFLAAARGRWWSRGLYNEPRILARLPTGAIAARYDLDGRCVAGDGYPPILVNPSQTAATPVYLVRDAHDLAWLAEIKLSRPGLAVDQVPHLVWAAKDADLSYIAKDMAKRHVVIARSRHDPSQEEWARHTCARLLANYRITADVTPPLPSRSQLASPARSH